MDDQACFGILDFDLQVLHTLFGVGDNGLYVVHDGARLLIPDCLIERQIEFSRLVILHCLCRARPRSHTNVTSFRRTSVDRLVLLDNRLWDPSFKLFPVHRRLHIASKV